MIALFKYFDKLHESVIFVLGITLVLLLGAIDHLSGYEASFSIFYLLPISLVSWFGKRNHSVIISVMSAAAWLWADLTSGHTYSHFAIPIWNSLMRLGFFFMATFSLSAIKKLLEKEQALARNDFLTGVANRMAFNEIAKGEIARSVRFSHPFTIAYIDIDNFKQVNDLFGHSQGDYLLQAIAKTKKENTRSIDLVARLGGDEFAIMFPETGEEDIKTPIGKLQAKLLNVAKNNNWPITFSIGVVTCYKACKLDELIKEADNLMYAIKRSGKNSIEYKIHEIPRKEA